jgi:hypothetical protein
MPWRRIGWANIHVPFRTFVGNLTNIEILTHTEIRKMMGGKVLEAIELENTKTHEPRTARTSAVFPESSRVQVLVALLAFSSGG